MLMETTSTLTTARDTLAQAYYFYYLIKLDYTSAIGAISMLLTLF